MFSGLKTSLQVKKNLSELGPSSSFFSFTELSCLQRFIFFFAECKCTKSEEVKQTKNTHSSISDSSERHTFFLRGYKTVVICGCELVELIRLLFCPIHNHKNKESSNRKTNANTKEIVSTYEQQKKLD